MTGAQTNIPGLAVVGEGWLVSTNPATGAEVARVRIAGPGEVAAAVERARAAAGWWAGLGVGGRRTRLLGFRSVLANQLPELAELLHRECGKPVIDGVMETTAASPTSAGRPATPAGSWAGAGSAGPCSPRSSRPGWRTGPWAWSAPLDPGTTGGRDLCAGGLGAGRRERHGRQAQRVHPGGSQWLADRFAEVVPEHPVLQVVHGLGDTGAALGRAGVDKLAVIGSTATAKKVMATCAETLTPILAEGGGKDAMIVAADHPGRRPRGLDRGPGGDLGPGPGGNRVGDVEEAWPGPTPCLCPGRVGVRQPPPAGAGRRLRSGMTAVNSGLSFAATPSLPSGGVGDSGFGRLGGDDGLREFARSKAITTHRAPSLLPA